MKLTGTMRTLDDNRGAVRMDEVFDTDIDDLWLDDGETHIEAWLTAEGSRTRLVVEERGLRVAQLHFYAAGWQVHLEDLGRSLSTDGPVHPDGWSPEKAASSWHERWTALTPAYESTTR